MYAWALKPDFDIAVYIAMHSGPGNLEDISIYTFPQTKRRIRRRRSAVESQRHIFSFLEHTSLYTMEMSHVVM